MRGPRADLGRMFCLLLLRCRSEVLGLDFGVLGTTPEGVPSEPGGHSLILESLIFTLNHRLNSEVHGVMSFLTGV